MFDPKDFDKEDWNKAQDMTLSQGTNYLNNIFSNRKKKKRKRIK